MPNKFHNTQPTEKHDAPKSPDRKGKPPADGKPNFKQVVYEPIKFPSMKDDGFKSKQKMTDVVS